MGVDLAVVTGGAGGLGRLITQRLAERGMRVVIADTDHAAATQLITELHHRGRQAVFVDTDAADADAVERLMTQAADRGTLRVLVNNAGGWLPGPQYPDAREWRRSVDLNLVMPMLAAQLAVPMMINSGGSIVNVSYSGGIGSRAYASPEYGAAKAGLIRFTSCLADWADSHRIRVNCVIPHWIGLDRARHQFEQLTDQEKHDSGGLVEPRFGRRHCRCPRPGRRIGGPHRRHPCGLGTLRCRSRKCRSA
jgi:NAD(P)-dependent dehydrogenase (short-subunit alcohol dehydrogenase family)